MAVGVADGGGEFDAGVKLGWNRLRHFDAVVSKKLDGIFELTIIRELDAECGALGVRTQAERVAQLQRQ